MKLLTAIIATTLFSTPVLGQSTTATGTSRSFNPAISVNGLFLGLYNSDPFELIPVFEVHSEHDDQEEHDDGDGDVGQSEEAHGQAHGHGLPANSGISVQEIEIRLTAAVDVHFAGDITLAIPGTEGLELEEGFVTTTGLPNVSIKAGKFFVPFGKHNLLHTHAFPFLDSPMIHERILGGEGLNEVGVEAGALLPLNWFSELTIVAVNGDNSLFNSPNDNDLAYFGRTKNLWDLNDDTTLELGGSVGIGKNDHREWTKLVGGDMTVKWRPARRNRDRGLTLQAEYVQARVSDGPDLEVAGGFSSLLQVQTARKWWIQARYDGFGFPSLSNERSHRYSALIALVPSEFSALRLQYTLNRDEGRSVHQVGMQLSFTMGSHPAHVY